MHAELGKRDPLIVRQPYPGFQAPRTRAGTWLKTDEVLAAARNELQAQLGVVREEQARLAAEEAALTHAL